VRTDIKTVVSDLTPLFALARRGIAEVVITGVSYFKTENGAILGSDPSVVMIARSLLKPWQFLACDTGGTEAFWALGLSSHSGQAHHMDELQHLSQVAQAGEDELFCPRGYPLDPGVSSVMQNAGIKPSRMHHPCAGKHLLMLAACRRHDFPIDRYWDSDHPIQKRVTNLIGQYIHEKPIWMTDSCGLPTMAVSARGMIGMWERLITSDDPKVLRMRQIWHENIRLVGGYGRLESDIMEASKGRIIAKEGADGLLMLTCQREGNHPSATCFIKLASGYSTTYLALALWSILSRTPDLPPAFRTVNDYLKSRLEKWVPGDQELVLPPF
jgi:L-asparaginase II